LFESGSRSTTCDLPFLQPPALVKLLDVELYS
jgi:hypothetical protein